MNKKTVSVLGVALAMTVLIVMNLFTIYLAKSGKVEMSPDAIRFLVTCSLAGTFVFILVFINFLTALFRKEKQGTIPNQ